MLIPDQSFTQGKGDAEPPLIFSGSAEYLETCSLVLSSVGIRHTFNPGNSTLTVPASSADAARYQLEQYFHENTGWPEKPARVKIPAQGGNPPTLLMIGGLIVFFLVTGPWSDNSPWFRAGAIDSRAILEQGEWWRLVTALTLHADQVHLLGNCIIGGFLVHMLCKTMGTGLGWFSLITCGALGNLLNILLRDQAHHSVGFSTSIFAAVGLFSGLQILAGRRINPKEFLAPLGAGAGLLAMLGTEGERTDLGAHFFGFACGLGFGFLVSRLEVHTLAGSDRLQKSLFVITMLVIFTSWMVAWQ